MGWCGGTHDPSVPATNMDVFHECSRASNLAVRQQDYRALAMVL